MWRRAFALRLTGRTELLPHMTRPSVVFALLRRPPQLEYAQSGHHAAGIEARRPRNRQHVPMAAALAALLGRDAASGTIETS